MDELSAVAKQLYTEKVQNEGNAVQAELDRIITGAYNRPQLAPDLFEDQDQPKLCVKVTTYPEVVAVTDAFDIVYDAHLKCKHGDIQLTQEYLSKKYILPRACVQWVIESCFFCNPELGVTPSVPNSGEWRISLVQPYEDINILDPHRRSVMIFKEDKSNFLQLRPIKMPTSQAHLGQTLSKLFHEFGFPQKIYVTENLELYEQCLVELFRLNNGRTPRVLAELSRNNVFDYDKVEVLKELADWANESEEPVLDIGCYVVQYKVNTTRKFLSSLKCHKEVLGVPVTQFFMTNEI